MKYGQYAYCNTFKRPDIDNQTLSFLAVNKENRANIFDVNYMGIYHWLFLPVRINYALPVLIIPREYPDCKVPLEIPDC